MVPSISSHLSGNITQLKHEAYGKLVVHMQGEQNEIHRALSFLQEQGIIVEGGRTDYGKQVLFWMNGVKSYGKPQSKPSNDIYFITPSRSLLQPLGVTLVLTRPGGQHEIKSSILFLIRLLMLFALFHLSFYYSSFLPFTKFLMGTSIGVQGVIVPLVSLHSPLYRTFNGDSFTRSRSRCH